MQFFTVREAKEGEHVIRRLFGGRRFYGPFRFRVSPEPMCERIIVDAVAVPDSMNFWAVELHLADIASGVNEGLRHSIEYGTRYCGIRLTVVDQKYHDVHTHSEGMRKEGFSFVTSTLGYYVSPIAPFRAEWLTTDVIALAIGIRADAATDRYLILSDALREAGCEDPLIHDHLQTCPDHGSSCWVVEMILDQTRPAGTSPAGD